MLCDCDIEEKDLLLLCLSKWLHRKTVELNFLHFFVRDTKWVKSQALSVCLAQSSTRSRIAWAMTKMSTDVQAVAERLLWTVTACGMPFEEFLGFPWINMQGVFAELGAKARIIVERPLLTLAIRAKRLDRCQMLVNDLKSAPAGRVIIFSDAKTYMVDPVRSRRNHRYLSLEEENEITRTVSKMKHRASVMLLGFVASNGVVMPLIKFSFGYRLTGRDYGAKLTYKLFLWINNTFDMSSVTDVLQQDSAPAHTSNRVKHFLQE